MIYRFSLKAIFCLGALLFLSSYSYSQTKSINGEELDKQYIEEQLRIFQKKLEKESWDLTATIDYEKRRLSLTSGRSAQKNATLPLLTTYSIDDTFNDKTRRSRAYWSITLITPYDRMIEMESSPYGKYSKRYRLYYSHKRKWETMLDDTGITNFRNICNEFIRAYPEEAAAIIAQEEGAIVENTERDKRLEEAEAEKRKHFKEQIDKLVQLMKENDNIEVLQHGINSKFVLANDTRDGFYWSLLSEKDAILLVFHNRNNTHPKFKVECNKYEENAVNRNKLVIDGSRDDSELIEELKNFVEFEEVSISYSNIQLSQATCGPLYDAHMCSSKDAEPGELGFIFFQLKE